ncbi:MAG: TRAP transporter substrate-binding protein [Sphaerochaetaceae bacterium]|nr:TRAP transporter substrate-binding protein [Sphaerochaetaceae bacterium]
MKKVIALLLVLALVGSVVFAQGAEESSAEKVYKIKLSHSTPEGDQIYKVGERFKELAAEYSNGRIQVDTYPIMQLGGEQENVQDVATGSIETAIVYTGNFKPFAPSVGVLMLPYIFTSNEEAWNGMDSIHDELNERVIAESGTRILGYFDRGFRYLTNSKKPVRTIDDLKGLKIRVSQVDVTIETFRAWGIEPIPMAWDETPTALQQRVVDGQENPYATIDSHKFYETQEYVTEIHYMIWTGPLIINNALYESMPADLQDALDRAGKEAAEYGRQIAQEEEVRSKKLVEEKGMTLLGPPSDEEVWQEKAQSVWPKFYEAVGGKAWVEQALSLMGR